MSLADLVKLKGEVISPMNGDKAGHAAVDIHTHNMLSAAARMVEAMNAHDAHGVHAALTAHHEAWTAREAADEKEESEP
jgi:hypothetical protein